MPAAGALALSIALWAPEQIGGSAIQLGINLVGMTCAGIATLILQRVLWRWLSDSEIVVDPAHREPR